MRILIVILALIAAVVTTLVSSRPHLDQMETRLSRSVAIALNEDERFGNVEIQFDHLKGTLSGTVPTEEAKRDAEKTARRNRMAGRIVNEIKVLQRDQASQLLVTYEDGEVFLKGSLPSEEIRNALVEAASSAGQFSSDLFVSDRVQFSDWQNELILNLPDLLKDATKMRLEISPAGISAQGGIRGEAAKSKFIATAENLQPGAIFTQKIDVLPDLPAQLVVVLNGKSAKIGGRLPNESQKNELSQQMAQNGLDLDFGDLEISPRVIQPTWLPKVTAFLPTFVSSGIDSFELSDSGLTLIGKIKGDAAKEKLLLGANKITSKIFDNVEFVPDRPAMIFATLADGVLTIEGELAPPESGETLLKSTPSVQNEVERDPRVIRPAWQKQAFPFVTAFFKDAKSGAISIRDNNLLLSREIKGEAARDALVSSAQAQFPSLKIDNQITLEPDQPAKLVASLKNQTLTLSGQIDDVEIKKQLLALTNQPSINKVIADELAINRRVIKPQWSVGLADFLKVGFANITEGSFELDPSNLRLERTVIGKTGNEAFLSAAKKFWPEAKIENFLTIQPDQPVLLQAALKDGKLRLNGLVQDQATKEKILAAASEIEPLPILSADIKTDPMVIFPEWMDEIPNFLTSFLSEAEQAELNLKNGGLELTRDGLTSEQKGKFALQATSFLSKDGKFIDKMKLAPDQPSVLTAVLSMGNLQLIGTVPTESLKAKIETAANAVGKKVSSKIQVSAEVAPPDWEKALPGFLTDFFDGADSAELEINGKGLRLKRQVPDNTLRGKLLARANLMLPEGAGLTNQLVLPPDKPANLEVVLTDGAMRLKGWIPDDATKNRIGKFASILDLAPEKVDNSLRTSSRIISPAWVNGLDGLLTAIFKQSTDAELTIDSDGILVRKIVSSTDQKDLILAKAKPLLPEGGKLTDEITVVIPKIAHLKIELLDGSILLSGLVPSQEISDAIGSAAAKLGDFKLTNDISIEEELEIAGWEKNAAPFIATFFAETEAAKVELTPTKLTLNRRVADEEAKTEFLKAAKAILPKEAELIDQIVVLKPSAAAPPAPAMNETEPQMPKPIVAKPIVVKPMSTVNPTQLASAALVVTFPNGGIQLSGALPDRWSRDTILEGSNRVGRTKNNILIVEELPKIKWPPAIGKFLPVFAEKAAEARLEIAEKTVLLFGETKDTNTKEVLLATLAATLPDGFEVRDHLHVAEEVTKVFSEAIPFRSGSTWISPESKELVEAVSKRILEIDNPRILIKGFADSADDPQTNTIVSEMRAKEIRDQLIELGIKPQVVEVVGAGENAGGKRVEITVVREK